MAIKKELLEKIQPYLDADIESAELYFSEEILPKCLRRIQRFESSKNYYKKLLPDLSKRSSFTMSDVANTVYWVMPTLMRIFFGGKQPVTINGVTPEDDPSAMRELVNWQLKKKNKGFIKFYRWFMDALQLGHGVVKVRWIREEKDVEETVIMSPEELISLDIKGQKIKLVDLQELPDGSWQVDMKRKKVVKNFPQIENVPVSEFAWLPDTGEVRTLHYCHHKKLMTRSEIELAVKAGVYDPVTDEDLAAALYYDDENDELSSYQREETRLSDGAADLDKSRQQYWVYESYALYDINDDLISEPVIVTKIGDKIVRIDDNELERPHFAVLSPYPEQYQVQGKTFDDLIGELQDIRVAITRQVLINIANNNERQAIVNQDALNPQDLKDNKRFIRASLKHGAKAADAVSYFPEAPMSSAAMPMMDFLEQEKENRTGVTKYNQGSDSDSLNKTATGITAIMSAANQRIELIVRIFAETGVLDLFELLVEMDSRYIDDEQVVRLTEGKSLTVRPDDLKGDYDMEVSAGVGAGQRQEATQNMMLLLNSIYPTLMQLGLPVDPKKIAKAAEMLIEQMGYKDASKFIPTVEELEQMQAQQAQQEQMDEEMGKKVMASIPPDLMAKLMADYQAKGDKE